MVSLIWDWNGTLLNDLNFCVSTINILLKKRDLTLLNPGSYKEVFSFPVKDYYKAVGFDFEKEDFSIPAREFIDLYDSGVKDCVLHNSAIEVLTHFKNLGERQFVLSAMKQNMLEQTLKQQNIFDFFEGVAGLNDHYAASKIERGEQLISAFNIEKSNTWIIGDTIHDFEVAESLGTGCILIADGHQSVERLQKTGEKVIGSLQEIMKFDFLGIQ
jgi:phosphoglycolate phosphatase